MASSEQVFWQNVLLMAVHDATIPSDQMTDEGRRNRDAADSWIRSAGRDFKRVCSWAGFDPEFIHDAYVAGRIDGVALRNGRGAS